MNSKHNFVPLPHEYNKVIAISLLILASSVFLFSIFIQNPKTIEVGRGAIPGDVNGDGVVDIIDFQLLSNSFGKSSGQSGFNANADFNKDNVVDILDFQILSNNFGKIGTTATPTPVPLPTGSTQVIIFQESSEDFPNPERGFYEDDSISGGNDYTSIRNNGHSLIHAYIRLDNYRSTLIPDNILTDLDNGFTKIRSAKIKVIVRMTYNFDSSSPDTSKYWIDQHLGQLQPIFAKNQDVIYLIQAGFIGAWGEWHSSTNFNTGTDGNGADFQTLSSVYSDILNAVPGSRMSALRYPAFRMGFFQNIETTSSTAFNGSAESRTGFHDDCFLSDTTNEGTYNVTGLSVQQVKDYISRQTKYVPMTGETCSTGRVSCNNALSELEYMHWSALNSEYNPDALTILKNQGCYNEIHSRLGYRLALTKITLPVKVSPGSVMPLHFELVNKGYASLYNERPVFLVLENTLSGTKTKIQLSSIDPRRWLPVKDQPLISFDTQAAIPASVAAGTYRLYLWLPDASAALQNIPEYSVRLANQNVWQATTGYNLLIDNLIVQ